MESTRKTKRKRATPPPVHSDIAGGYKIGYRDLSRALGKTAFQVWLALIWRRDIEGVSFATANRIAKTKQFSRQQVIRATMKLKKAGLVQPLGWILCEKLESKYKRFARKVYGDYRNGVVLVPSKLKKQIIELPRQGGKREGAGRKGKEMPKSKRVDPSIKVIPNTNQNDTHKSSKTVNSITLKSNTDADKLRQDILFLLEDTPFPSAQYIGVAKLPPPPKLEEGNIALFIKTLASSYRAGIEARYNKKCYAFTKGDIEKSKYRKALEDAAKLLKEFEIAPMAWVAWSCDKWLQGYGYEKKNPKNKFPPVAWVYSAKRIEQRKGWFDRERASYSGGQLYFTDRHKTLLTKYDGFRRDCLRQATAPIEELVGADEIEQKWFPGGWEQHYEHAKVAAARDQERLDSLAKRGEFIW